MLWPSLDTSPQSLQWISQSFVKNGLHDAAKNTPENSMRAFENAVDAGFGIEVNVRLTLDNDLVVFNDPFLDRLTNESGPVSSYKRAELVNISLQNSDQRIMMLTDMLHILRGRTPVLINAHSPSKDQISSSREEKQYTQACFALRRAVEGYRWPFAIFSQDWEISAWFFRHHPKLIRGVEVDKKSTIKNVSFLNLQHRFGLQRKLWRAHPHFVVADGKMLPTPLSTQARQRHIPVLSRGVSKQRHELLNHADGAIFEAEKPPESACAPPHFSQAC